MKLLKIGRVITSAALISMLLGSTVSAADQQIDPLNGSTIEVNGTADATTIVATVPTSLVFAINTNNPTPFTSVPAIVTSDTPAPLDFQILGIVAEPTTSTKVVSKSAYLDEEWKALGVNNTNSKIALGIEEVGGTGTIWSLAEVEGEPPSSVTGTINLDPLGTKEIQVNAKHGNAWQSAKTLKYKLFVRVALTQE